MDMENDGDQDILYVGALSSPLFSIGSPAVVLENLGCSGVFQRSDALPRGKYNNFGTNGLSAGDLNNDGFVDLVVTAGECMSSADGKRGEVCRILFAHFFFRE